MHMTPDIVPLIEGRDLKSLLPIVKAQTTQVLKSIFTDAEVVEFLVQRRLHDYEYNSGAVLNHSQIKKNEREI